MSESSSLGVWADSCNAGLSTNKIAKLDARTQIKEGVRTHCVNHLFLEEQAAPDVYPDVYVCGWAASLRKRDAMLG
jgi:hypothetical protein